MTNNRREEQLNEFIDDLLQETKPRIYKSEIPIDEETEKMFETVRALKRMKGNTASKKVISFWKSRWLKGIIAAAAAFVLILGLGIMDQFVTREGNIVHAVVSAYEELHSYKGVAEIRSEQENGDITGVETIDIHYEKPFKYSAHHRFNGQEKEYLSDGNRLAIIRGDEVTVDNLFPERELWRYHIGTSVWELERAAEVNQTGTETFLGREAVVLEYRYPGDEIFHELWIDEDTDLPLRKVLNTPEGSRLVVEFKELQVNPAAEPGDFEWELPGEAKITELNEEVSINEASEKWPLLQKALTELPQGMQFLRAGIPAGDFFEKVARFRGEDERDFVDIYFSAEPRKSISYRDSEVGTLAGGYVELNSTAWNVFERYTGRSSIVRWFTEEKEVFIVSSRKITELQEFMEKLAGEEIKETDIGTLIEKGIRLSP